MVDGSMPPGGGVPEFLPGKLELFRQWIEAGYPEVRCETADGGVLDGGPDAG